MAQTDNQGEKNNPAAGDEGGGADAAEGGGAGAADAPARFQIHLLDLGSGDSHQYGDCVLCQFGDVSVLIDGGHSIDADIILPQLKRLLGQTSPVRVSLIIVSHPHDDHIGCLPRLVAEGNLVADWALLSDPQYRWGAEGESDDVFSLRDGRVRGLAEALLEHDRTHFDDEELVPFIDGLGNLEARYRMMIRRLREQRTRVVLHGTDAEEEAELVAAFAKVGLEVIGPTREHLEECARLLRAGTEDAVDEIDRLFALDAPLDVATAYRNLMGGASDAAPKNRGATNLQSIVTSFTFAGRRVVFGGDMQFADPQVESQLLLDGVEQMLAAMKAAAPYAFVKLSHHGSDNGFSEQMLKDYGEASSLYGICCGNARGHHPHPTVLALLNQHRERLDWVRTDRNGLVTITFGAGKPRLDLTRGDKDDPTSNLTDGADTFGEDSAAADFTGAPAADSTDASPDAARVESSDSAHAIHAQVPPNATRVEITVELAPAPAQSPQGAGGVGAGAARAGFAADSVSGGADVTAAADAAALGLPRATIAAQLSRTRTRGWLTFFNDAARQFNWPAALLLAIASRESNIQNILGDGGHGRGIMQIDDRSFPEFARSGRWRDPRENILMGARVLSDKRRFLSRNGVAASSLTRASVAAYNSGEGNVLKAIRRGLSVDAFTAHGNYSADVLARADGFTEALS